jgi:hypothetical protein
MVVSNKASGIGASIMRDRAVSQKVQRLLAVWAVVASFIATPYMVFHLSLCLKCSIEQDGMPEFICGL